MVRQQEQLILGAAIGGPGALAESGATAPITIEHYRQLLRLSEAAKLDFVLLDDARAFDAALPSARLDALAVLSRLAPETTRIGLAASKPTTYSEPFHVSRELATLDFVSGGRAAWDVTINASRAEARNYGEGEPLPLAEQRTRSEEFIVVSRKLWDSWEDDAVITDRARGLYIDPAKLHHIDHAGQHFQIRGPQITYRPPQGHVVVIQREQAAAPSPNAAIADVIILQSSGLAEAQEQYARLQGQAAAAGRTVRVLQSVLPILTASADDAAAQSVRSGAEHLPVRPLFGTPSQIVDQLSGWFDAHAADGFYLLPAALPADLGAITTQLVPELQRRGLFRSDYNGTTLRDHLGLPRPLSQYTGAASEAFTNY
jgi:alkanesulfonate monooxygenase SsuD/methylene tetrahydromethanopterin reductase-like flavin-dependent oxidoreductase (luciferase family)